MLVAGAVVGVVIWCGVPVDGVPATPAVGVVICCGAGGVEAVAPDTGGETVTLPTVEGPAVDVVIC